MSDTYVPEAKGPLPHIERDEFYECFRVYLVGAQIDIGTDINELREKYPDATGWRTA